jgi:hypothetical protein
MAKSNKEEVPGQLELIDVDDPKYKEVKRELLAYDTLKIANQEEGAARRKGLKDKKKKVIAAIVATGEQPDSAGTYHFLLAGKQWDISQPSELKIKKHNAKDADPSEDGVDKGATE